MTTTNFIQAKACDPDREEEKIVESVAAKRITKRHEADLSGRKEDEEEDEPGRSNVNDRRTHARRERRKRKHVDNVEPDDRKGGKLLARISRMLRRRLEHASGSPKLSQRSIAIELEEGRGSSEEEENTREDSDDVSHVEGAAVASSPKFRRPIDLAQTSSEETNEKTPDRRYEKATIRSSRFRRSVGKSEDTRGESQGHKGERRAKEFRKSGRRRQRRDLGAIRRLGAIEPAARRDSVLHRKSSRATDERRLGKRNDLRREGTLVVPFNPRTSKDDSDENNFYGFFRQPPARGFPESDVYGTVGVDSSESIAAADYDYVQDDDENDDGGGGGGQVCSKEDEAEKTRDHVRWLDDGHGGDHAPIEFLFENVRPSSARVGGEDAARENYGDLWEAESAKATGSVAEEQTKSEPPGSPDSTLDQTVRDARPKRSSPPENFLVEEMFQENDEGDAGGCRRRVIRNSGSLEEEEEIDGSGQVADSREIATDRQNGVDLGTEEEEQGEDTEMEEAITNELERSGATTEETPIGESGGLDHGPSNIMRIAKKKTAARSQANDAANDDERASSPETTNVAAVAAITPVSPTELSVNNTDLVATKRTFFPARSPEARSAFDEATTLDSTQTVSAYAADTAESWGRRSHVVFDGDGGTARREKSAEENVEKETTESRLTSSSTPDDGKSDTIPNPDVEYPGEPTRATDAQQVATEMKIKEDDEEATTRSENETTTYDASRGVSEAKQTNVLREDNDERVARSPEMRSDNEAQVTTNIQRKIADESIDTLRSDRSVMKIALREKKVIDGVADIVAARKKDDADTKSESRTTPSTVHRVPLRKLTRHEEYLMRRAEHIDRKLKEILVRREKSYTCKRERESRLR